MKHTFTCSPSARQPSALMFDGMELRAEQPQMGFPYLYSHVHLKGISCWCCFFYSGHLSPIMSRSASLGPEQHITEQLLGNAAPRWSRLSNEDWDASCVEFCWKVKTALGVQTKRPVCLNLFGQFNSPQSLSQPWRQGELLAGGHTFEVRSHTGRRHTVQIVIQTTESVAHLDLNTYCAAALI